MLFSTTFFVALLTTYRNMMKSDAQSVWSALLEAIYGEQTG